MKVRVAAAAVLALVTSELLLRGVGLPRKHDLAGSCDPMMTEPDARTGWRWRPSFTIVREQGGRRIPFAFDADADRAPAPGWAPEPSKPTILFAGESIVEGHALLWRETMLALVSAALDVQTVNLGVQGYGSDQAFVRLVDALPRFEHVVAVVTLFFPGLVDRELVDELLVRPGLAMIEQPYVPIPGDGHPDPASARRMAGAVSEALQPLRPLTR
ncbi:MAG: hypothetical protein ACRELB_16295 [Polyangiaceae bacterium]